jgi:pSer/pThr/pTyr-binding forkhead associated (FHA) protein
MNDTEQVARRRELALQGPPHRHLAFFPLKLFLQPSGPVVELTRPDMLMGRHSEADVQLPLPDVSRRHCRFLFVDQAWEVFDLDSLNGIYLNGERVRHAVLCDQDVLTIGGFRFQIHLSGSPASPKEVIHRIADVFPETNPDSESQRRAS